MNLDDDGYSGVVGQTKGGADAKTIELTATVVVKGAATIDVTDNLKN